LQLIFAGCSTIPEERRETRSDAEHPAEFYRLPDPRNLLRLRSWSRLRAQALHEEQQRLLSLGPLDTGMGCRTCLHLGQSWRARSNRDGRLRREVRNSDQPLLLGRRNSGHGLRRRLHDALLLWLTRALGSRVSEA